MPKKASTLNGELVYQRLMEAMRFKRAAHLAKAFGVKPPSVQQWKNGEAAPDRDRLYLFCVENNIDYDWVIGAKKKEQKVQTKGEQLIEEIGLHFNHLPHERRPRAEDLLETVKHELERLGKL